MGLFDKLFGKKEKESLDQGLQKTKEGFLSRLTKVIAGKSTVDEEVLDNLEDALVSADVGIDTTVKIIQQIEKRVAKDKYVSTSELNKILQQEIEAILVDAPEQSYRDFSTPSGNRPYVILVVGVNGVGKTTTIGKLARRYTNLRRSVLLAAGDTFRAAAVEQLRTWGDRNAVPVIAQGSGADSASVIFDALQTARSRGTDVLIADTAGRLHTQSGLMDELSKIRRVLAKLDSEAPHEVLLVIDGTTGQNAISQTRQFREAIGVTGLVVTKLDGTAKGGIVFALAREFGLPIRYVGLGESADDLRVFDAAAFVDGLLPAKLGDA